MFRDTVYHSNDSITDLRTWFDRLGDVGAEVQLDPGWRYSVIGAKTFTELPLPTLNHSIFCYKLVSILHLVQLMMMGARQS